MSGIRGFLALLALLSLPLVAAEGQTNQEIGAWHYIRAGGMEAMYTESTDPDRTFSLEVICEDDEPKVELTYLLASPADDFGLDPDRFTPDGDVQTQLDGNGADGGSWSFSTASETFIHEKPDTLLTDLGQAKTMQLEVRDTHGANVGEYTFNLEGVSSALESLSCYQIRSEDGE